MKLSLRINRHTTASELVILGAFFESLSLAREGHVSSVSADEPLTAPTDPAELQEPEVVTVQADAPKRRRRTKAEIEAAAAAEVEKIIDKGEHLQEPEPTAPEEAAIEPGQPGNEAPAPTPPATETPAAAPVEPATASPSDAEPPTPVSLNIKATAVAKKIGPEKIKAKINELGGKLISTLSPEALVEFDKWLDAQ